MPRRKKNVLPKEELKFVESPKYIYHKSSFPVVHLSTNPVTLKAVPAKDVCKKWVVPCFDDFNQTTPVVRGQGRRPRGRGEKSHVANRSNFGQNKVTSVAPEMISQRKRPHKLKPIPFHGLNDQISDVEDVSDGESDECLIEPTDTEEENNGGGSQSKASTGENKSPADKPDGSVVTIDLSSTCTKTDKSDADRRSRRNSKLRDELTFLDAISHIETPEDSDSESPVTDPKEVAEKLFGLLIPDSIDPAESILSPQSLVSDASQSLLQERSSMYSPLGESKSKDSSRAPPSVTRDPMPVFLSSLPPSDYSAGSAEWFRDAFLDRVEEAKARNEAQLPVRSAESESRPSEGDPSEVPSVEDDSQVAFSPSPGTRACELFRSVCVSTPGCSGGVCLAEETPELERGLDRRALQVRDRPKVLRLIKKSNNKRQPP